MKISSTAKDKAVEESIKRSGRQITAKAQNPYRKVKVSSVVTPASTKKGSPVKATNMESHSSCKSAAKNYKTTVTPDSASDGGSIVCPSDTGKSDSVDKVTCLTFSLPVLKQFFQSLLSSQSH